MLFHRELGPAGMEQAILCVGEGRTEAELLQ